MDEELIGFDYLNQSLVELMHHPDFSREALRNVSKIIAMTSAQLEALTHILKGDRNG